MDNKRLMPILLIVSIMMMGYFYFAEKNKPVAQQAAPITAPVAVAAGLPTT